MATDLILAALITIGLWLVPYTVLVAFVYFAGWIDRKMNSK